MTIEEEKLSKCLCLVFNDEDEKLSFRICPNGKGLQLENLGMITLSEAFGPENVRQK